MTIFDDIPITKLFLFFFSKNGFLQLSQPYQNSKKFSFACLRLYFGTPYTGLTENCLTTGKSNSKLGQIQQNNRDTGCSKFLAKSALKLQKISKKPKIFLTND